MGRALECERLAAAERLGVEERSLADADGPIARTLDIIGVVKRRSIFLFISTSSSRRTECDARWTAELLHMTRSPASQLMRH